MVLVLIVVSFPENGLGSRLDLSLTDTIYKYIQLLRNLQIAYTTMPLFRECIDSTALKHLNSSKYKQDLPNSFQLNTAFLLDEIAMCLRITELDEYHYEYYPSSQIDALEKLYSNEFDQQGLSVETLIGGVKRENSTI